MTDDRTLDTLDDATLRGIAYGRADSESERMRAQRAARILADRGDHARGADAALPAAAPAASVTTQAEVDDEPHGWWSRPRKVGAVLLIAGLMLGLAAGVGGERLVSALTPASLSVFDREATERDTPAVQLSALGLPGQVRHLGTSGDAELYAVRTSDGFFSGAEELGAHICVTAVETDVQFVQPVCVPEAVFGDTGLDGLLLGSNLATTTPLGTTRITRALGVEWGPTGGLTIHDLSDDVRAASDGQFSGSEREAGVDLPLVREMLEQPPHAQMRALLIDVGLPPLTGPLSLDVIVPAGGTETEVFASMHDIGDGVRGICLTLLVDERLSGDSSTCTDVGVFRASGLGTQLQNPDGSGYVALALIADSAELLVREIPSDT